MFYPNKDECISQPMMQCFKNHIIRLVTLIANRSLSRSKKVLYLFWWFYILVRLESRPSYYYLRSRTTYFWTEEVEKTTINHVGTDTWSV